MTARGAKAQRIIRVYRRIGYPKAVNSDPRGGSSLTVDYAAFIRRVGVPAIRRYLGGIGVELPGIDDGSDPGVVYSALQHAAPANGRVWAVFQDADAFSPRYARASLRSVLISERGLLATFDAMSESNRECALWLAATRPDLFEHAVSALNTSRLIGGRSWDGFRLDGCSQSDDIIPALGKREVAEFERLARTALNSPRRAMPDGKIKAVPFQRLLVAGVSHGQRKLTQITIYAEGPHESRDRISEANEVRSEVVRRVDEGAVLFDPKTKTIEVVVFGGASVRQMVAEAFCEAFFPAGVKPVRMVNRDIDFSLFGREPGFPLQATDPVEDVAVDEIRFSLPDSGGALVTLEQPYGAASPSNIYRDCSRWPEVSPPERMSSWEVVAVRLRFLFKGDANSKKRRLRTVELKAPNRTNLREKSDADHAVMYELLERWGVFTDGLDGRDT